MRLKDSTFLMIDERIELAISRIWDYGVYDLNENDREEILLPVIRAQTRDALVNPHIRSFIDKLSVNPDEIPSLELVPWVPVTMFKEFDLATYPADDIVKFSDHQEQPASKRAKFHWIKSLFRIKTDPSQKYLQIILAQSALHLSLSIILR